MGLRAPKGGGVRLADAKPRGHDQDVAVGNGGLSERTARSLTERKDYFAMSSSKLFRLLFLVAFSGFLASNGACS